MKRGKGLFYAIKFASRHARESTLSALHAFASRGQRFERKSLNKAKKKKKIK